MICLRRAPSFLEEEKLSLWLSVLHFLNDFAQKYYYPHSVASGPYSPILAIWAWISIFDVYTGIFFCGADCIQKFRPEYLRAYSSLLPYTYVGRKPKAMLAACLCIFLRNVYVLHLSFLAHRISYNSVFYYISKHV